MCIGFCFLQNCLECREILSQIFVLLFAFNTKGINLHLQNMYKTNFLELFRRTFYPVMNMKEITISLTNVYKIK